LKRFFHIQCVVSMQDLTNTRLWKDKEVLDYIDHWRSLSLECKDRDLFHILQMIMFQEFVAKAYDMEMMISSHRGTSSSSSNSRQDKDELKKSLVLKVFS